jgi:hypothetical protein
MKCTEFKLISRNTLQGFATIEMGSGLVIKDCALHLSNGSEWCAPPSKPHLDQEGNARRGPDGKLQYTPIISFATKEVRDNWSRQAVQAISHYRASTAEMRHA